MHGEGLPVEMIHAWRGALCRDDTCMARALCGTDTCMAMDLCKDDAFVASDVCEHDICMPGVLGR